MTGKMARNWTTLARECTARWILLKSSSHNTWFNYLIISVFIPMHFCSICVYTHIYSYSKIMRCRGVAKFVNWHKHLICSLANLFLGCLETFQIYKRGIEKHFSWISTLKHLGFVTYHDKPSCHVPLDTPGYQKSAHKSIWLRSCLEPHHVSLVLVETDIKYDGCLLLKLQPILFSFHRSW